MNEKVFLNKANVDLGDLTSSVLINTASQMFLSTAYSAFIPYIEFDFHRASASEQVQTPSPSEEELSHLCLN